MARPTGFRYAWIALGLLGAGLGCAGTRERPTDVDGAAGGAGGGSSGGAASGGAGASGGGTNGTTTDGPGRVIGADALGDTACATATQKAEQVPLDLYIMMDSSGSMADTTSTGQTKWAAVVGALTSFVQDPLSAGLGVGIQYFPQLVAGVPDSCDTNNSCGSAGPCGIINTCSAPTSGMVTSCASNADCRGQGTCVRLGVCGPSNTLLACAPAGQGTVCSNGFTCAAIPGYCNGRDRCDVAVYATPAVEVAALPGVATAVVSSLGQHMPDGLTPTSAALSGAISHAQAIARANPTHKVVVLLATDGEPDECTPADIAGTAQIAAAGLAGTPAISTYVIGVFAESEAMDAQMNLNTLAAAGGTGKAFVINTSQNVSQSFVSALNSVRSSGLACQYMVPVPPADGGQLDYYSVNVQFTSGSGQTVTIGNVKDRASCSPTQGGWYYDVDPSTGASPQTISICDTTCSALKADATGRVDVLLGCQTIFIVS